MPSLLHQNGRFTRAAVLLICLAALSIATVGFLRLGHVLHHEDPLRKADVIYALAGARYSRVVEAGQLQIEGWAPVVLLSQQIGDEAEPLLAARGIRVPNEVDLQRMVLVQMGVPADRIEHLTEEQMSTATEAEALKEVARLRGFRTIIVVTAKLHTARARLVIERRLAGTGVEIIMRAPRHDRSDIDRWWANRGDLRFSLFEAQKLVAYWLRIAD